MLVSSVGAVPWQGDGSSTATGDASVSEGAGRGLSAGRAQPGPAVPGPAAGALRCAAKAAPEPRSWAPPLLGSALLGIMRGCDVRKTSSVLD